ncbi:MAG TPA: hypothetical protein DE316_06225 [Eubacterium sp.]|nr:hypothetical protein [Eubacterium sp.]
MFNKRIIKKAAAMIIASVMCVATFTYAYAAGDTNNFRFSDIDLSIKVPKELICFTRTTTNNNSYLEKLGVDEASVLTNNMIANKIYLEAVPEDVGYEIVVYGNTASKNLGNLNELSEDELNSLYNEYVASQSAINNDNIKEELESSELIKINDIPYFVTNIHSVSNDVTVYSQKYYTVVRGYIYTYAIQSKTNRVSEDMTANAKSIISSASYAKVRKSLFENSIISETLSNIITVGIPIIILAIILYVLVKVGPKGKTKRLNEEAKLRAEYKKAHENNNKTK